MFRSARIKLTIWYVLIIMIISGLFSLAAFQNLSSELARSFRAFRRTQLTTPLFDSTIPLYDIRADQDLFDDARNRIALELAITNVFILIVSGGASYFLAGKTLKPIEKMMEEQKRFVSDASHELRTPLTAMKTEIEVALREKKMSSREARLMLLSNLEEVNKMQALSNYLLSLNKYQNNSAATQMEIVDLQKIINKAVDQVMSKAMDKNIRITKDLDKSFMKGNELSLIELIVIFLDNAIKYSHNNSEILVSNRNEGTMKTIAITDNGIGIADKDIKHIFDRFYRADTSRSKFRAEGYGLGLSIAKSIIELHKGKIEVKSQENKGTTFTIYFA